MLTAQKRSKSASDLGMNRYWDFQFASIELISFIKDSIESVLTFFDWSKQKDFLFMYWNPDSPKIPRKVLKFEYVQFSNSFLSTTSSKHSVIEVSVDRSSLVHKSALKKNFETVRCVGSFMIRNCQRILQFFGVLLIYAPMFFCNYWHDFMLQGLKLKLSMFDRRNNNLFFDFFCYRRNLTDHICQNYYKSWSISVFKPIFLQSWSFYVLIKMSFSTWGSLQVSGNHEFFLATL